MSKTIKPEELQETLQDFLENYSEDIEEDVKEAESPVISFEKLEANLCTGENTKLIAVVKGDDAL